MSKAFVWRKNNEFISRADVVQLLHVKDNKAYRLLRKLVDQGVLEGVYKGRYAKYTIRKSSNAR